MPQKLLVVALFILILDYSLAVTRQELYELIKSTHYDAHEPPPPADRPTEIKVGIYVNSLAVERENQRIVWTIYLRQAWNDSRLTSLLKEDDKVLMGQGHWKDIWYPDVFFRNSIEVVQESTPSEQVLLGIRQDGLWFVQKLRLTTTCYGLHKIGKTKSCPLMIESFKYTMNDLYFTWLSSPVDFDAGIQLPYHVLTTRQLHDCSQNYTAGAFPCLQVSLLLEDDAASSVVAMPRLAFAIGTFLVIVSWFSFWMDGDRFVERFGLLLGTVMANTLLGIGLHVQDDLNLPGSNSYIFSGAFAVFIVAAMLEYIIVYGVTNWIPTKLKGTPKGEFQENPKHENMARTIDIACGFVFALLFVLFFIIYLAMGL